MKNDHFTAIVIGNNHSDIMSKYDNNLKCEPYVVLQFKKAHEYKENFLKYYNEALKITDDIELKKDIQFKIDTLIDEDDIDFYLELAEQYEIDQNTGDAISNRNRDGKYDVARVGKNLSLPLIDNNGNETFLCRKGDVDFSKIHFNNTFPYEVAWETVMEGVKPFGEEQEKIYENMKNLTSYFQKFETKENYVACSTAFWGYAYVDKDGWIDLDSSGLSQFEWVTNFYEKFIEPLNDDEIITVYECILN